MSEILEKVEQVYGTTDNCEYSTFLLPNGEFLDPSKYFAQHPLSHLHDQIIDKLHKGMDTITFLRKTGALRYRPAKENINIVYETGNPVTKEQLETLERCACFYQPERPIMYDIYDCDKKEHCGFTGTGWTGTESDCFKGIKKLKRELRK